MKRFFAATCLIVFSLSTSLAPVNAGLAPVGGKGTYIKSALIGGKQVQRWNDQTRVVMVNIQSGSRVKGWNPAANGWVKQSFSQWEQAMGGRIRFQYTTDPMQSDVTVKWSRLPRGEEIGFQDISWVNNILTDNNIELAVVTPKGRPFTQAELRYVTLHEIGHMMGLRGHSDNPNDIMYPTIQARKPVLSARDLATVRELYHRKANITNPVGAHLMQYKQYMYYAKLGASATEEKDFTGAYNYYIQAKGYYPSDTRLPFFLGISAYNAKHYGVAIENLQKAAMLKNEDQPEAQYFLANALNMDGTQDIMQGRKDAGLGKLSQAKTYYSTVQKNPKARNEIRKMAGTRIANLDSVTRKVR